MTSDSEIPDSNGDRYISIVGSRTVETVPAKTRLAFVRDDLFPNMPLAGWNEAVNGNGEVIMKFLGVMAAPSHVNGEEIVNKKEISISLPHYGRADFIPVVFSSSDGTIFSGLYRRGVGGTRNLRRGDFNAGLDTEKPSKAGLASGDTSLAENEISKDLHEKGVRIRLPVLGMHIDEVQTEKGYMRVEDLVKFGILRSDYLDNRPMVIFFARRNPYTFADAVDYVKQGGKPQDLLKSQAQYLRREVTEEAKKVADLIDNNDPEAMKAWFRWMAKTFGQQVSLWANIGFLHPAFHGQNMSLAVEAGDTGGQLDKFKLKPITEVKDDDLKIDFADQGFSALFFLNSLLKNMGETAIEKSMIDSFVDGMFEQKGESTKILVGQMLKMLGENDGDVEYLKSVLGKKLLA